MNGTTTSTINGDTSVTVSDTETWEKNKRYTVSSMFLIVFLHLLSYLAYMYYDIVCFTGVV